MIKERQKQNREESLKKIKQAIRFKEDDKGDSSSDSEVSLRSKHAKNQPGYLKDTLSSLKRVSKVDPNLKDFLNLTKITFNESNLGPQ